MGAGLVTAIVGAVAGSVATVLLGALGFFLKRYLSGEAKRDRASLLSNYAAIAIALKENGLSLDEVENIERLITARARSKQQTETSQTTAMSPYWTQASMNERAAGAAEVADAQLASSLVELSHLLDEDEKPALSEAQAAWGTFRDQQAAFAMAKFQGGSIAPLIGATERESLTRQRAAALKMDVEERKRQQGV